MSTHTFSNDPWLTGFIDGEGYFAKQASNGRYYPSFKIGLHHADLPILQALQAEFGGSIYNHHGPTPKREPAYVWQLCDRKGIAKLVAYLERFPLRAKKAQQFATWRRFFGL